MPAFPRLRSTLLSQFPNVACAMSTRQGEDATAPFGFNLGFHVGDEETRVQGNLRRFLDTVDLAPDDMAFMDQVHEDRIAEATEAGEYAACDGLFTRQPRLGLAVRVADCVPILLYAPAENTVAAVHAGWRGTAEHLAKKMVATIHERCGCSPDGVYAYIGAGAGPCCYKVGHDVAALFPAEFVRESEGGKPTLDLPGTNRRQLLDAGVRATNIEVEGVCTICSPALFHSHRRDGAASGRMLAVITLLREAE